MMPYWVTRRMAPPRHVRYRHVARKRNGVELIATPDAAIYARRIRQGVTMPWRKVRDGLRARRRSR